MYLVFDLRSPYSPPPGVSGIVAYFLSPGTTGAITINPLRGFAGCREQGAGSGNMYNTLPHAPCPML